MKPILFYTIVFCSLTCINALGATWYVPDHFPSIQGAISNPGVNKNDTVIVRSGVYYENINFYGKEVIVRSEKGAAFTIIDGNYMGPVVVFNSNLSAHPVLDGFTLRNGSADYGGGIYCKHQVYPHIRNCIISGNSAVHNGGGVYCEDETAPYLNNCILTGNFAKRGGGIYCFSFVSPVLTNCIISDNTADLDGGGVYSNFYGNVELKGCTLYGNSAKYYGGGIYAKTVSWVYVINSILWKDKAGGSYNEIKYDQSTVDVTYSNVYGGWYGKGNINADPQFADAANNDFHLLFPSPCRNVGDNSVIGLSAKDFEGDPRIENGTVDMGADEFHRHLYCTGDFTPGGNMEVKIVGDPGLTIWLYFATGVLNPPLPSPYGDWHLTGSMIGPIVSSTPQSGLRVIPFAIPVTVPSPLDVYMQSFVGPHLSNLFVMGIR